MIAEPKNDDKVQRLSKDDIIQLKNEGYDLDENGIYVIRFLFNDKPNKAYDPEPFQVDTAILDELAQDSIGMPWIVPPYGINMHVRPGPESKDPVKDLLELQKEYTIGKIKIPIRFPSNNVFGIIDVLPKFEGAVSNNLIPPLVSPTLNIVKMEGRLVKKAQFLNLQSVPTSGYPANLTSISSMCKGGIKKCMDELVIAGAAGKETSKSDRDSFSYAQSNNSKSMSQEGEITLQQVAKTVEDHGRVLSELQKGQSEIQTAVSEIKTALGGKANTDGDKPKDAGSVAGAAGAEKPKGSEQEMQIPENLKDNEFVKALIEKQDTQAALIKKMNDESEAEKAKTVAKKRQADAESIVTILIKMKKVEEKNKDAEIKKYVNLANEDKSLVDLGPIEATLKSIVPTDEELAKQSKIEGAYGLYSVSDITADKNAKPRSNLERLGGL